MVFEKSKKIRFPTIFIFFSANNTVVSLVDSSGSLIFTISSGHLNFKGSNKGTQSASQHLAFFIAQEAGKLGFYFFHLKMKGLGKNRNSIAKDFLKAGITVSKISDTTCEAFNGCRNV